MRMKILLVAAVFLFLLGCIETQPPPENITPPGYEVKDYCKADSDCVRLKSCCDCGLGIYVNSYNQNNSECTGPVCKCALQSSHGECQDNKCVAVPDIPPPNNSMPPGYEVKDFCEKDSDCVRQKRCCDCGLGEYVNIYNVDDPECTGPQCLCPIMLSRGECRDSKCVAAKINETLDFNESRDFYFRAEDPACGSEKKPIRQRVEFGTKLNGSIGVPNPCHILKADLIPGSDLFILNLTSEPTQTFAACTKCKGSINWIADIYNYQGKVQVYYDGRLVLSDLDVFCGWNLGECDSDQDCYASGCYREVCQSRQDIRVFTNCDPRDCYDSRNHGLGCGCVSGRCAWH